LLTGDNLQNLRHESKERRTTPKLFERIQKRFRGEKQMRAIKIREAAQVSGSLASARESRPHEQKERNFKPANVDTVFKA
jgi:hypothetical protein